MRHLLSIISVLTLSLSAVMAEEPATPPVKKEEPKAGAATDQKGPKMAKISKTDEEWKKSLTPEQYRVLRQKGTERAFSGEYAKSHDKGTYQCAGCGTELFSSDTKFDSGTGWPSFFAPVKDNVAAVTDDTHGMKRTEVICAKCSGHLGHVFDDGPKPTNLRYCINSVSIKLVPKEGEVKK